MRSINMVVVSSCVLVLLIMLFMWQMDNNSDDKLRQEKPKRTGLQFLRGLISQLFLWTAAARVAYAQAAAEKNWAYIPGFSQAQYTSVNFNSMPA
jgi:hypothetical protein